MNVAKLESEKASTGRIRYRFARMANQPLIRSQDYVETGFVSTRMDLGGED